MLYSFELMLAGIILLTTMAVGGITLWWKRRKESQITENDEQQNL